MTRSICVWILLFFSFAFRSFGQTDVEQKTLQKIEGSKNDSLKVEYFTDLGYEFEFTDTTKSLRYFGQALSLSQKLKSDHLISMSLSGFGNFYIDNTNFDKARIYHRQALQYSIRSGNPQNMGRSFNNLGNIEYFKSNSGAALDYFLKACRQFDKSKDSVRLNVIYRNIASSFVETGQYKQAEAYAKKSLSFLSGRSTGCDSVLTYIQMTHPMNRLKNYKAAESFALLALSKVGNCQSEFIKAGAFHSLASNYDDMDQSELANRFVDSALVYYAKIQDPQQSGLSCLLKGITLAKLKQYKEAETWLNRGVPLVESQKNWRNLKAAYQAQAIVATQMKQYDKAIQCYEKYVAALNSSHNEDVTAQLTEMETRFETEKKQSQITQLEKEKQIQSLTIQQQNTWLFASVAGLTLAILLGFFVYRNSRQKQKIQLSEIENLRKEKQLDALSGIIKGEENERNRMAQDLHDGLGSLLSGVKLSLTSMKGGAFISETQTQLFGHSLDQLDNAISEMRRVAHNLMPSVLAESGLVPALQQFTESLNESGSIQVHFEHFNFVERLSKEKEIVAYRMIQEAVNNALRHSGGSQIILQISKMENQIHVEIEDNGKGFDPESVPSSKSGGIKNLQNRAQYLNGTIAFHSSDHGTTVHIVFPC